MTALVNIDHVLVDLKHTAIQGGAWVNVIGYIMDRPAPESQAQVAVQNTVFVQAVLLWETKAIKLDEYEETLQARMAVETASVNPRS